MDQINWPLYHFSAKIDCKDQNGYASIKPDIGAAGAVAGGWGAGVGAGAGAVRPGVSSPDTMARYTPGSSAVDSMARDRTAWMNTCSSLSAAAQVESSIKQYFWDLFSYKYSEVLPQIIFWVSFFYSLYFCSKCQSCVNHWARNKSVLHSSFSPPIKIILSQTAPLTCAPTTVFRMVVKLPII